MLQMSKSDGLRNSSETDMRTKRPLHAKGGLCALCCSPLSCTLEHAARRYSDAHTEMTPVMDGLGHSSLFSLLDESDASKHSRNIAPYAQ